MKPAPPFDADKARAERVAFWTRSANEYGREYVESAKMLDLLNREVGWMKREWAKTWHHRQIEAGDILLQSILDKLSSDDRELIEDYLQDRIDDARNDEYQHNVGSESR